MASEKKRSQPGRLGWRVYLAAAAFLFHAVVFCRPWSNSLPGLLAPSDSLKTACASIARDLPENVKTLRVFARPPVTFYLGRSAAASIERQASLSELLRPGDPASLALLDTAIVWQDQSLDADLERASGDWVLGQ